MTKQERRTRIVIMGAAGRDFHNFNMVYRDDPSTEVVAFTAAQIPEIAGRYYPAALAGHSYPDGIPIVEETRLEALCKDRGIDVVVFAYSDVTHDRVMHMASVALASGSDFVLLGPVGPDTLCCGRHLWHRSDSAEHRGGYSRFYAPR